MESISISKCINPQHNDGVWKAPLLRPTRRSATPPRRPNPLVNSPPPEASPAASSRKRSAPSARQETSFGCPAGHSSGPTAWPFDSKRISRARSTSPAPPAARLRHGDLSGVPECFTPHYPSRFTEHDIKTRKGKRTVSEPRRGCVRDLQVPRCRVPSATRNPLMGDAAAGVFTSGDNPVVVSGKAYVTPPTSNLDTRLRPADAIATEEAKPIRKKCGYAPTAISEAWPTPRDSTPTRRRQGLRLVAEPRSGLESPFQLPSPGRAQRFNAVAQVASSRRVAGGCNVNDVVFSTAAHRAPPPTSPLQNQMLLAQFQASRAPQGIRCSRKSSSGCRTLSQGGSADLRIDPRGRASSDLGSAAGSSGPSSAVVASVASRRSDDTRADEIRHLRLENSNLIERLRRLRAM